MRGFITIVALVLLASAVTGSDQNATREIAVPAAPAARQSAAEEAPHLDLEKLKRPKRESPPADLFASPNFAPPPAPVVAAQPPAPPPPPSAPPLPFRYLGKLVDDERMVIFLVRNDVPLSVVVGDSPDPQYRVEAASETAVTFMYLPLGQQQVLPIAAPQ